MHPPPADPGSPVRVRLAIRGAVQGVGFRPFVFRLASELHLAGWVSNSPQGVLLEVEGCLAPIERFLHRVQSESPPASRILAIQQSDHPPAGYTGFALRPSSAGGARTAVVLPDLATCAECVRELFDPADRRHRYPFINCTNCGPRFTIIEAIPYDRVRTAMKAFRMCPRCQSEYDDPTNRRFHAQPNACPGCGPHLELWDGAGHVLALHDAALRAAATALRDGTIVAVKGLGGFHLMADARDPAAVARLRQRKVREEKPFAIMVPDMATVHAVCRCSEREEHLLTGPESPIVLLRRRAAEPTIADTIAPGNPCLGVMLPYTPLHHLLLAELGFPVVATSGNRSDEPTCIDEREALTRLAGIADFFVVHNRPIVRHVDDSIVRVVLESEMVQRRSRGYAPLPVLVENPLPAILAVGGHLKNTVALAVHDQVCLSQHLGDLETALALDAFRRTAADLPALFEQTPAIVACDRHPDYHSTHFAEETCLPIVRVQHHHAHVLACMAEHHLAGPVLGVSWDGTGFGDDGTIWGGEFLRVTPAGCERVAHLRTFPLPGGDQAVREPRRSALGLLYALQGDAAFARHDLAPLQAFSRAELGVLRTMFHGGLNTPYTSSAGRLFDAVASLLGLRQSAAFEGQAAMMLELALVDTAHRETYPVRLDAGVLDWGPIVEGVLSDVAAGVEAARIADRFHNALVDAILAVAVQVGEPVVVLGGGCFQNAALLERSVHRLRDAGFTVYWPQQVPANDGGLALGQLLGAAAMRSGYLAAAAP
jgi:hydrogenase maturation protein HypF